MSNMQLFLLQRLSALVMVPLVFGHLGLMIYAVQGGLSAEEILGRTQGSLFWGLYYGFFVLAASLHGAIGLRAILTETINLNAQVLNLMVAVIGITSLALGLRAVMAVVSS